MFSVSEEILVAWESCYLFHVFSIVVGVKVFQDWVHLVVFPDEPTCTSPLCSSLAIKFGTLTYGTWTTYNLFQYVSISCLYVCCNSTHQHRSLKVKGLEGGCCTEPMIASIGRMSWLCVHYYKLPPLALHHALLCPPLLIPSKMHLLILQKNTKPYQF
jgi:hypothetical protein